jgi:hypothetical protein
VEPPRYLIAPDASGWYLAWSTDDGIGSEFHGGDDPDAAKRTILRKLHDLAAGRPGDPEQIRPDQRDG